MRSLITLADAKGVRRTLDLGLFNTPYYSEAVKAFPRGEWTSFEQYGKVFPIVDIRQFIENVAADRYGWRSLNQMYKKGVNIGAEKGYTTLLMAGFCDKTLSFEPLQSQYKILKTFCEQLGPSHSCRNAGAAEREMTGFLRYHYSKRNKNEEDAPVQENAVFIPLDQEIKECDFIKIDAYGMELQALKGMQNLLTNNQVDLFIAKYPYEAKERQSLLLELASLGYHMLEEEVYHMRFLRL